MTKQEWLRNQIFDNHILGDKIWNLLETPIRYTIRISQYWNIQSIIWKKIDDDHNYHGIRNQIIEKMKEKEKI